MTLADFLLARIDEDERQTRATCRAVAEDEAWRDDPPTGEPSPRIVAEWDAKRQLIAWLQRLDDRATDNNWWTIETTEALAILALPYADHPDYREEWRP